jgi:cytoskeleton protein RodZ
MLRTAREAQGLHIAALAVSLKVPVKKLEALEADRFDLLPDVVFVRALTLSVCRTLKLDPKTVMSALPQRQSPQMKTDLDGLNTTFQAPGPFSGFSWRQALSPVGLSIAALLIVIVAIAFWPTHLLSQIRPPHQLFRLIRLSNVLFRCPGSRQECKSLRLFQSQ